MTVIDHAPVESTTTQLLGAARAGDQAAWRDLVHRFEPAVTSTIVAHRLQHADAHDAAQRTWLRMVEHHRDIRAPEALGGWLRTTARHECLRIIRDRQRVDPLDDAAVEVRDAPDHVEQSVVDADTVDRLRCLVNALPARAAVLVTELFRDEPPGYAEIARRTGIPVGSIGPTRGRALRMLRQLFEEGSGKGADSSRLPVRRA